MRLRGDVGIDGGARCLDLDILKLIGHVIRRALHDRAVESAGDDKRHRSQASLFSGIFQPLAGGL